jgi:hypothetical protein
MGDEIAVQRGTDASNPTAASALVRPAYGAANGRVVENQGPSATVRLDVGSRSSTLATPADDSASHMPMTTRCPLWTPALSPPISRPNPPIFGEFSVSCDLPNCSRIQ